MSVAIAVTAAPLGGGAQASALDAAAGPVELFPETYPDLVPDVREVQIYREFDLDENGQVVLGPPMLAIDTWSQNLGTVAFDVLSDDPTNLENPTVSQCVSWAADACLKRRSVGGFEVHAAHAHIHFLDFARYELRKVLPNGRIDMSERGLLDISDKVSFCLFDATPVREDARPVQRYTTCTGTQQGVSAGWADVYSAGLPGQQLVPEEGLVDGRYAVVVTMDHGDRVWESDDGNNVVAVIIEVEDGATSASIVEKRRP